MDPNKIYIAHDIGKTELTPEQAKELLEGTELPPGMRKIIEGMSGMSRIEKIKQSYHLDAMTEYDIIGEQGIEDVQYLLSLLEVAEEALRKMSVPMPGSRDNELVKYYERTAAEALQQLRK